MDIEKKLIELDILDIIKYLYSYSLEEKDKKNLKEYINKLTIKELNVFKEIAKQLKELKKYHGHNKYKITSNSIKLTVKIYENTGVTTFPYIERIAQKGWSISDGTFSWGTYMLNEYPAKMIYSCDRVNKCLLKKNKLEYDINDFYEIFYNENKNI